MDSKVKSFNDFQNTNIQIIYINKMQKDASFNDFQTNLASFTKICEIHPNFSNFNDFQNIYIKFCRKNSIQKVMRFNVFQNINIEIFFRQV